jgi:ATP-binding cassette, subfamily B, bacterial MsbA
VKIIKTLLRFKPYAKLLLAYKGPFTAGVILGIIYALSSGFGLPFLMEKILPMIFGEDAKSMSFYELLLAAAWLPGIMGIRGLSGFFNKYLINYCGLKVLEGIRMMVFSKLQTLSLRYFQQKKSGDLLSRLILDANEVKDTIVDAMNDVIIKPIQFIGAVIFLIYLSFKEAEFSFIFFCLLVCALCMLPVRFISRKLLNRAKNLQKLSGEITASITESLQSPKEIKCYNLEDKTVDRFRRDTQKIFHNQLKVIKYSNILNPMNEFIGACGVGLAIAYLGWNQIEFSKVVPLLMALHMSYEPIKKMGGILAKIQKGLASLERLEEITFENNEIEDPVSPMPFKGNQGIEFKKLSFAYEKELVLNNINLTVKKDDVIALVGPSGSGKSTFVQLIPRLYDPTEGEVLISGNSLKLYKKSNLRSFISIVSQDTVLFNDNILENIRIGKEGASDEEIVKAAKLAYAHDFVEKLPDGYSTQVGEKGAKLSGGQKQRISIARAILKDAPILILDEATSALDTESETKIQLALKEVVKNRTVFMIAHRFSTISVANRICVFDQGEIIAEGDYETLYRECSLFKKLCDSQEF